MSANNLPDTTAPLLDLAAKLKAGLAALAVPLNITDITPADIQTQMTALETTSDLFNKARTARGDALKLLGTADKAGTALLGDALDVLKPHFGKQWNQAWVVAGFTGNSIAVPTTTSGRTALLKSFAGVFTDNPTWEITTADVTVTSAGLTTANGNSVAAANAVGPLETDADTKKDLRDASDRKLRKTMRGLINTLGMDLAGNDPRELQFGLNQPDADTTPGTPQNVHVVATTNHNLMATCDAPGGTTGFRWRARVVGVETEFELNATSTDPLALLTGFTAGQNVEVICEAVNGQASSTASAVVQATTT